MTNGHGTFVLVAGFSMAIAAAQGAADDQGARARRLAALQEETTRLRLEMTTLESRERGLLGEVARMDAAIALERARLEEATLRLRDTEDRLSAREHDLAVIEQQQAQRAPYLASRLREIYKRGPAGLLAQVLGPAGSAEGLDGFRYASYLARRDAVQFAAWRETSRQLAGERAALAAARQELVAQRDESERGKAALEAGRAERESLLARIRGDREQHARAIEEIDAAAQDLGRLVESLENPSASVALDVRKFRGLLDWPAEGKVAAGFGKVIHPKFKTEIPHPGLDIDAAEDAPFRAIFDGRVAYASALHGYGLTAVVDHGNGVVSVYAHASVLVVEAGQEVARGEDLGRVGETGSLRGPYLYFELRVAGKPTDPVAWLRRR